MTDRIVDAKLAALGPWPDVWPDLSIVAHGRLRRLWLGVKRPNEPTTAWFVDPFEVVELEQKTVRSHGYGGAPDSVLVFTDVRTRGDNGCTRLVLGNVATVAALLELEQQSPLASRADVESAAQRIIEILLSPLGVS